MNRSLTIRPYAAVPEPAVLALMQETLGNTGSVRKTEEFWRWKHAASPFGPSYGLVAWDEVAARPAGLRILLRWQFQTPDGHSVHAVRAVDTATHPDYRRLGLFSTLTRQAMAGLHDEGVDLIFNTPNASSLPGYLKIGWQVVANWPLYVRLLHPARMALRKLRPANPSGDLFSHLFTPQVLPWDAFVRAHGDSLEGVVASWEAWRRQVGLRTPRTVDYLHWRYGQHPNIRYGVYAEADRQGQLQSFAVLRPNIRRGCSEVVLVELCPPAGDVAVATAMLRRLARVVRGDYLVAHAQSDTLEQRLLRRAGFLAVPRQGMLFTVRPLQITAVPYYKATTWDLTLGDLEIF